MLSPLLWNLVVIELLGEIEEPGCNVVGLSDDLMIIVRGPFVDTLVIRIRDLLCGDWLIG